ncbi:tRNA uridine 5-oxyacetic acid(34) methyltransferase CmoM [Utexia brackfieldae]|uniref:tRNA uridine 5-oxyacetic acid(34) methyltransferase CmoM n=1 Tax=Utexia brackfieldae TaxID=3074108 RepID=UPI00370DD3D9
MADQMISSFSDRNFDDIAGKFSRNIYGTTKGKIRQAILKEDLDSLLATFPTGKPLKILDAGGGQGQFACYLASLGHQVTLCDISAEMLQIADENAKINRVNLNLIQCQVQSLDDYLLPGTSFDLILFHAVLEWVSEPIAVLTMLKQYLTAEGALSLMFYNYHALLFRTVTLGNFGYVNAGMAKRKKKTLSPDYPRKPEEVYQWLADLDFRIMGKTGIRVFHDFMVNKQKQQDAFEELLTLERTYCRQEPYIQYGRYIHVMVKNNLSATSKD